MSEYDRSWRINLLEHMPELKTSSSAQYHGMGLHWLIDNYIHTLSSRICTYITQAPPLVIYKTQKISQLTLSCMELACTKSF